MSRRLALLPHPPAGSDDLRRRWGIPAGVVGVLVGANVVQNRVLQDREGAYVASCAAVAAALLALARADGRTWPELGLAPATAGRGGRLGGAAGATAAGAMLAASATPATRALFADDRARRRGLRGALAAALVRVPLGTVLVEETAFRSVLPAVLTPRLGTRAATAASAVLFGLWHLLPASELARDNPELGRLAGRSRLRRQAAAVAGTAVAGFGFSWLRRRADSVVAPAVLHWAVNGTGYVRAATMPPGR